MGAVDAVEWACALCGRHIQNDWVEQRICTKFCIKLKHSSAETIWMIQKAAAMGNSWLAASSQQCLLIASHAGCFGKTTNHPVDSASPTALIGALQLLAFPKTEITFEREEISDHWWDSGKYDGELMAIGRTVWGPKMPSLKGIEVSLFWYLCFQLCSQIIYDTHSSKKDAFKM